MARLESLRRDVGAHQPDRDRSLIPRIAHKPSFSPSAGKVKCTLVNPLCDQTDISASNRHVQSTSIPAIPLISPRSHVISI